MLRILQFLLDKKKTCSVMFSKKPITLVTNYN